MKTCVRIQMGGLAVLSAVVVLLAVIAAGCSSDSPDPTAPVDRTAVTSWGPDVEISGEFVSSTECKFIPGATFTDDIPTTQTAVEWTYDGNGTLDLHRINAAFNCCPEIILTFWDVSDRTISVAEADMGQCYCLCLLDADYRITGLPPGKYMLLFHEYVALGEDDPLQGEILLKGSGSSGTIVVDRTHYPWGE